MSTSPCGYKSPYFIPLLFFHLSVSLLFLFLLPPASSLLFICVGGVDCLWLWSGDLKGSAEQTSSSKVPGDLPSNPPSRLAWASLLSLFTSLLSLRLSGHVFLLPAWLQVSCFLLLFLWTSWFSSPLSPVRSDHCCWSERGRYPALTSSLACLCILVQRWRMSSMVS